MTLDRTTIHFQWALLTVTLSTLSMGLAEPAPRWKGHERDIWRAYWLSNKYTLSFPWRDIYRGTNLRYDRASSQTSR